MLHSWKTPSLLSLGAGPVGRWKLWAFASAILMVATIGTWIAGQYQIGRLDSVKKRYEQPVQNFAKMIGDTAPHAMERDLLESCKQSQIGTWLQTTEALRFDGPLTGNRIDVRLDSERAYIDINGTELSECIQDEIEDRQFDIGSMTGTWSVILMLATFCMGLWSWMCYLGSRKNTPQSRNIYAETLAMATTEHAENSATAPDEKPSENLEQNTPDKTVE